MPRWNRAARRAARALSAAGAGALCACAAVGPNFKAPAAPDAAGYAMPGDPAAAVVLSPQARTAGPWWRDLGSPQLDRVMDEALAGNRTVAVAVANLDKARQQTAAAAGARLPQVDANAGIERTRINTAAFGFTGFPSPTVNLFSIGGTVSYDLDLFGGMRRRVEAATAAQEAAARRADAAYLTLTGNVAMEAAAIAALDGEIAAVGDILADDQRNIDIVRAAQQAGGEPPSAAVSGEAQLAADQALLPPLEAQRAQARHALALLVGRPPSAWSAPDFALDAFAPPAAIPVSLPSTLVRNRPDILAAEADLHEATALIGVETASLYPDIRLSANLTQTALAPESIFSYSSTGWALGAGLAAPIFHGGTLRANRRAAQAQARAALATYEETVLTAFAQVADTLAALAADDQRIATLEHAQSVAQQGLDDVRAAWRLGGGALLPVTDAQRQLSRARLDLAQARGARLADVIRLYAATAAKWT